MSDYKKRYSEEYRKTEFNKIHSKYPDRIPIIVCRAANCKLDVIDKEKYLVPKDMVFGQFIFTIRKRINLDASEALFIMISNGLIPCNKCIQEIYDLHKEDDGFLYVTYTSENTFG